MKIVVTGTRGIPDILGGVETHCEELFPRIAAMGNEVTIIRRKNYTKSELSNYKGVNLVDIETPKKKAFEAIIHTFKAIVKAKQLGAEVVHIHAIGPALLTPMARVLGMKVVFTHHGPDYDRDKWGTAAKIMLKMGERMGCMFANRVIVISEVINNILKTKYNRKDGVLIYNGVPVPKRIESTDYLESLGVKSKKYIFAMGRFVPEKNFHQLINAFSSLNQEEYQLVLAGDADFEDAYSLELKKIAKRSGIILTGFVKGDKLQELLTHAKLFVLPSSHEGLPISLLEAMSYKLPVLVSNIPANNEVGLDEACYFPVGNEKVLAEQLAAKLALRYAPVAYHMEKYNWDRIAEQTLQVYKTMVT